MKRNLNNTKNFILKSSNLKILTIVIIILLVCLILYLFTNNRNYNNLPESGIYLNKLGQERKIGFENNCKNSSIILNKVFDTENIIKATKCTPNIFSLLNNTSTDKFYKDIPLMGLGTFQRPGNTANMSDIVYEAIKIGYRCFDCAVLYGNQFSIGVGIQRAIKEGIVKREDLFIIGKGVSVYDFEITIRQLQINKLDLALLHDFIGNDAWKDIMIKTKNCRLADKVGVCNIYTNKLTNLLQYCNKNMLEKPYIIENEINVFCPSNTLVKLCNRHNIKIIAHTPLGRECLDLLWDNPVLKHLSNKYSPITIAQLILLWNMRRGITIIPSSVNINRLKENFYTYKTLLNSKILTPDEVQSITNINGPDGTPTIQISFGAKKFDNDINKNYIILQHYQKK